MKKVAVCRNSRKPQTVKQLNMRINREDQEINRTLVMSDSDCMMESQTEYIDNLQQQVFVLENEIAYLRTYMQESSKQQPSMIAEGERMVKKLSDCQGEIKNLKIEVKRKQTTVDLLRSERDRVEKSIEESEERFRKEKCKILEELITLQNERDSLKDSNIKAEASVKMGEQEHRTLQEDFDNLQVQLQQIERENLQDKEIIHGLFQSKEILQKDLYEAKMTLEAKTSMNNDESLKEMKSTLEQLYEEIETLKRSRDHEHLLRERLSQDNLELIKRHSELEAELSEVKAHLREEQSRLSSLEQVHLGTILESSEAKSRDVSLKEEIDHLQSQLKCEREQCNTLAHKVADEQRFRSQEQEKFNNLQQLFDQREENMKTLKSENITLSRDNTYLKDQVLNIKQQLQNKDQEVLNLKHKVQEMQISVEEFIQTSQAATRLAGERWKQLGQLAQSIQALTCLQD